MDFSLTDEQQAVVEASRTLFTGRLTDERRKEVEASAERIDRTLWSEMAAANLLGLAVAEEYAGSGLSLLEVCLLLEEVGRAAAPVPALPTLVSALAVAEFGSENQRRRWLPGVVAGEVMLGTALIDQGTVTATRDEAGWRLDGSRACVQGGLAADVVLVPAGGRLFLVETGAPGVIRVRQEATTGIPDARLVLDSVSVGGESALGDGGGADREGAPPRTAAAWLADRYTVALCALAAGVCEAALRLTAEYTKTREQFERPIASFQAVGQRAADAYIDTEGVRLTARQAAWRLANGHPAEAEIAVAKFWAADGGQRVVHAASHLHGGIGVDRDYALHRYFLLAKQIELTLGGATRQLLRLGAILADAPTVAGAKR